MVQKTRRELQRIFKTGAKPSSEDFKDFIESTLNITDDGLEKSPGANSPLKISAQGSTEKLLDFYVDDIKTWSIDQRLNENSPGFNLCNASGSKLFIADSNGNVGINTSSPTAKLQIQQTGNEDALRINDESGDNSPLIVKSDGKVGIGTTSPTAKLQIQQTGNEDALRINDESGDNSPLIVKSDGKVGIGTTSPTAKLQIQQTGSEDALRINDESGDNSPLIVKGDGKVGIGTTSPTAKLQINGNLKLQSGVAVNEFSTDVNLSGNSDLAIPTERAVKTYADTKALLEGSSTQDFAANNLTINGKVGIGRQNPTEKLEINGKIKLQSGVAVNEFSTDVNLSGNSDLAIPTEKAVKTYVQAVNQTTNSKWKVTEVIKDKTGTFPMSGTFTTNGGTILIWASASTYRNNDGFIQVGVEIDNVKRATMSGWQRYNSNPRCLTLGVPVVTGLAAGTHTLRLACIGSTTSSTKSAGSATVMELPF